MKIAIITAIYGEFDEPPPVPKGFDEAILVSDKPVRSDWKNIVRPIPLPNRLAAKIPKFRPDVCTSLDASVWMDAACRDSTGWLAKTSRQVLEEHPLSAFRHPVRTCIYEEARCCRGWPKHRVSHLGQQIRRYREAGYPENAGLWAGGVLMRRHTDGMKSLGDRWFFENAAFSSQDQISLPYLLWEMGIPCNPLPDKIWYGPLEFVKHKAVERDTIFRRGANKLSRVLRRTLPLRSGDWI